MRVIIKKSSDNAAVQLPASVMTAANLHVGQTVEMTFDDGAITLRPARSAQVKADDRKTDGYMEELVAQMQLPHHRAVMKGLMTISTKDLRASLHRSSTK